MSFANHSHICSDSDNFDPIKNKKLTHQADAARNFKCTQISLLYHFTNTCLPKIVILISSKIVVSPVVLIHSRYTLLFCATMRKSNRRQKEIIARERFLLCKQRRGQLEPCFRPCSSLRDGGALPFCIPKTYPENPTTRFCPECARYMRNVSSVRAHRAKRAQSLLVMEFQDAAVDTLAQEKSAVLATSEARAKELVELKATMATLKQDIVSQHNALSLANADLYQHQCHSQHMAQQLKTTRADLASHTYWLGKETAAHRITQHKLEAALHQTA